MNIRYIAIMFLLTGFWNHIPDTDDYSEGSEKNGYLDFYTHPYLPPLLLTSMAMELGGCFWILPQGKKCHRYGRSLPQAWQGKLTLR
jgi:hypothetical protein